MFCTSASDRPGSQKGYPQSRWFKIAPLTRRALLFSRSFFPPVGTSAAGRGAAVPISKPQQQPSVVPAAFCGGSSLLSPYPTLTSSLLAPRASSLPRPLLLGTAAPALPAQPSSIPVSLPALSCHHPAQSRGSPCPLPALSSPTPQHPRAI